MEIEYKTNKLRESVENPNAIMKNYGKMAKQVKKRLEELKAVKSLEDFRQMPQANCHELTNNRKGELALDISANYRIIIISNHDPKPKKEDGGLDWSLVNKVKILAIGEDYH